MGGGESLVRRIEIAGGGGTSTIENDGTGALIIPDLTFTQTGTRVLQLAGSNIDFNEITAKITNNGGSTTAVTKSNGGTWVLSNPANDYTGTTIANGGVLILAADGVIGAGLLQGGNGAIQAINGDRTISNVFTISNANTIISGLNSFTFNGVFSNLGGNSGLHNFLPAGEVVRFTSTTNISNDGTARIFTMTGTGTTIGTAYKGERREPTDDAEFIGASELRPGSGTYVEWNVPFAL